MANLINRLQKDLPRGAPFGSETLHGLGISNDLANQYVRSGWLIRLGRGVFMHAGDGLDLNATLAFLETRFEGLHVAAKSALARHGYRQNLTPSERLILWGPAKAELPDWFTERFPVRFNRTRLFSDAAEPRKGLVSLPELPNGPRVAEPELALLEMLSEVGVHQEMEEARAIFESMRQIRSKRLMHWLGRCRQVKAVRLCAYLATELNLPWAEKVVGEIPADMLRHRWVSRLKDGTTMILPAMASGEGHE